MHELVPIGMLAPGSVAEVLEVLGDREHVRRLQELGFRQGREVEMVRSGSPCIVKVAGARICFRPNEMLGVFVGPLRRPAPAGAGPP